MRREPRSLLACSARAPNVARRPVPYAATLGRKKPASGEIDLTSNAGMVVLRLLQDGRRTAACRSVGGVASAPGRTPHPRKPVALVDHGAERHQQARQDDVPKAQEAVSGTHSGISANQSTDFNMAADSLLPASVKRSNSRVCVCARLPFAPAQRVVDVRQPQDHRHALR